MKLTLNPIKNLLNKTSKQITKSLEVNSIGIKKTMTNKMSGACYNNSSMLQVLSKNRINSLKKIIKIDKRFFPKNKLVEVNAKHFDEFFKQETHSYISKNGKGIGAKKNHYNWIKENWILKEQSFSASEVFLEETGNPKKPLNVIFHEGRHRYAVLRDMGMKKIPLSFDKKSIEIAKKFALI